MAARGAYSSFSSIPNGNVYYNVNIPNNNYLIDSPAALPAEFRETRSSSVITGRPSDYQLAIVRAKVPTTNIPLKIMEILPAPGNSDINKTAYSVTLSWSTFVSQQNIIWVPQNVNATVPNNTISTCLVNPNYMFYYSLLTVQHFLNLINAAFAAAAADLVTHGAPATNPPFLYYNVSENRIAL